MTGRSQEAIRTKLQVAGSDGIFKKREVIDFIPKSLEEDYVDLVDTPPNERADGADVKSLFSKTETPEFTSEEGKGLSSVTGVTGSITVATAPFLEAEVHAMDKKLFDSPRDKMVETYKRIIRIFEAGSFNTLTTKELAIIYKLKGADYVMKIFPGIVEKPGFKQFILDGRLTPATGTAKRKLATDRGNFIFVSNAENVGKVIAPSVPKPIGTQVAADAGKSIPSTVTDKKLGVLEPKLFVEPLEKPAPSIDEQLAFFIKDIEREQDIPDSDELDLGNGVVDRDVRRLITLTLRNATFLDYFIRKESRFRTNEEVAAFQAYENLLTKYSNFDKRETLSKWTHKETVTPLRREILNKMLRVPVDAGLPYNPSAVVNKPKKKEKAEGNKVVQKPNSGKMRKAKKVEQNSAANAVIISNTKPKSLDLDSNRVVAAYKPIMKTVVTGGITTELSAAETLSLSNELSNPVTLEIVLGLSNCSWRTLSFEGESRRVTSDFHRLFEQLAFLQRKQLKAPEKEKAILLTQAKRIENKLHGEEAKQIVYFGLLVKYFKSNDPSRLVKFCSDKKIDLVGESNDYYWATLSESEKIEKMNERLDLINDKLTEIAEKDMKGGKKVLAMKSLQRFPTLETFMNTKQRIISNDTAAIVGIFANERFNKLLLKVKRVSMAVNPRVFGKSNKYKIQKTTYDMMSFCFGVLRASTGEYALAQKQSLRTIFNANISKDMEGKLVIKTI